MSMRLVPVRDHDSAPYWSWHDQHELRLQHCAECGTWRWPARAFCGSCRSERADWERLTGMGTVTSWIRVHHATADWYREHAPYVVVTVAVDEQPDCVIPGNLVGTDDPPRVGLRVRAVFERIGEEDGATLLQWSPARTPGRER
jgi:uncharacterized protein